MLKRTVSISFNSDPISGSILQSADGSVFSVDLNRPLMFDRANTLSVEASILQASIWNTSPNISALFSTPNNAFNFTTSAIPAGNYTIVFPDGLYSLSGIGAYISAQLVNLGLPASLFTFSGNDPTQQSIITFQLLADEIDFSVPNSIGPLLGFSTAALDNPVIALVAGYAAFSQSTAQLNRNNSYQIRSNLISGGIQVNAIQGGILTNVPIDSSPGTQINYQPQNLIWFSADELIGNGKQSLIFYLQNQSGQPTPTAGDYWSFVISLRYVTRV